MAEILKVTPKTEVALVTTTSANPKARSQVDGSILDWLAVAVKPLACQLIRETLEKPKAEPSLHLKFNSRSQKVQVLKGGEIAHLYANLLTGEVNEAQPRPLRSTEHDMPLRDAHAVRVIQTAYQRYGELLADPDFNVLLEFAFRRGLLFAQRLWVDCRIPTSVPTCPPASDSLDHLAQAVMPLACQLIQETLAKPQSRRLLVLRFDHKTRIIRVFTDGPIPCFSSDLATGTIKPTRSPLRTPRENLRKQEQHAIATIQATYHRFQSILEDPSFNTLLEFYCHRGVLSPKRFRFDCKVSAPKGLDAGGGL